jgi:hypothetical protein
MPHTSLLMLDASNDNSFGIQSIKNGTKN